MEKYTIYCTPEQTKKAFELGADLDIIDCDVWLEDRLCAVPSDVPCQIHKMTDYLYYDGECDDEDMRRDDVILIEGTEEYGDMVVYLPTAEQMIGWLEEQENIAEICIKKYGNWRYDIYIEPYHHQEEGGFSSRKEATLAAIDVALEYLSKK